ncbi:hypothetical protein [Hymenobacter edaphi]|uniref:hypothetical protein n=1 Tax=Hymenobacter edaphi TaxID=2211146 RepID=UPI001057D584|nr:hypothetical protein [Hymenobacter edaphi]
MRAFLLLLFGLLTLGAAPARAQQPTPTRVIEALYDQLSAYQLKRYQPDSGYQLLTLPSTFSGPELAALRLRERQLVRVDLVYSAYRFDPKFSQRQLNLDRLRNLDERLPGLLQDPAITWNLIEQTGCTTPDECQQYFHGFVLYIEKRYTRADTKAEIGRLAARLNATEKKIERIRAVRKSPGKPLACGYPHVEDKLRKLTKRIKKAYDCTQKDRRPRTVTFQAEVSRQGKVLSVRLPAVDSAGAAAPPCPAELTGAIAEGLAFSDGFLLGKQRLPFTVTGRLTLPLRPQQGLKVTGFYLPDSLMRKHRVKLLRDGCQARQLRPGDATEEDPIPNPDPNVVTRVLERHPEWQKQTVVADVTGSMYPYTADLLIWLQLAAAGPDKTFVFFNDGDDLPDKQKRLGQTGGLYDVRSSDYARIRQRVVEAMSAGGGGDAPENDCEALLRAHQLAPDAQDLILVADNHTFPRDTKLLEGTRLPVKIILCGVTDHINPKYLALARRYGYSLHTLDTDLSNLSELPDNQITIIEGVRYQATPGGFRRVSGRAE